VTIDRLRDLLDYGLAGLSTVPRTFASSLKVI